MLLVGPAKLCLLLFIGHVCAWTHGQTSFCLCIIWNCREEQSFACSIMYAYISGLAITRVNPSGSCVCFPVYHSGLDPCGKGALLDLPREAT